MGKRRFNEKGRQIAEIIIDNSATNTIKHDLIDAQTEYGGYDQSNALILPSEKRVTKVKREDKLITRILSKKQRKILEKVVERKKKRDNRASLLEALATVQVPKTQLKQYTSISQVQTKGLKRHFKELEYGVIEKKKKINETNPNRKLSSIAVRNKKRKQLLNQHHDKADDSSGDDVPYDPNTVKLGESSSSEDEQTEEAEEIKPATESSREMSKPIKPEVEIVKPVVPILEVKKDAPYPTSYVHVDRSPEVQVARMKLPILGEEQVIMETINENQIIIIAGETGSGKTTQVPQFLYEAGYAKTKMIGITEPRRVAAISMSKRVGEEMNLSSEIVSYLIRFEGNTTEKTKLKFMTDGVLLKEIETDFLLSKYSVIILDEAHERSVYTDILVGLLSRIVPTRNKRGNPLKLIIMSATLRVQDFTSNQKLFKTPPPVIEVDSRQFPVTIHFNKRTSEDYVKEAYNKAVKVHTTLPEGGILIFVTGQQEVHYLMKKLRKAFPFKNRATEKSNETNALENDEKNEEHSEDEDGMDMKYLLKKSKKIKKKVELSLPRIDLDSYALPEDSAEVDFKDDDSEIESEDDEHDTSLSNSSTNQPLWVLPLYSMLPSNKQSLVFQPPPDGTRLCVVATNVAETSLTIPNVKYVVDSGRQKTRIYDKITGISAYVVTYTSKAGANQRAGRAGRTAPGHCYRLYSSAVFENEFEEFSTPEIQKKPVEDLMLQMKSMGIDKVANFPFPSPPDQVQLEVAEEKLKLLGALKDKALSNGEVESQITELGQAISAFPVSPKYGKMLALSHQANLLPYTICMVSALSVQEVLEETNFTSEIEKSQKSKWLQKRKAWAGSGNSLYLGDPMVLLRAVGAAEYAGFQGRMFEFCQENGLRTKAITEIRKLRKQLINEINLNLPKLNLCIDPQMEPPTDLQAKLLRQIILAGMGDHVARRIFDDEIKDKQEKIKLKFAYNRPDMEDPIFMHQDSVLKKKQPDWVIYQEIFELQNGDTTKMFMRGITAIEPEWLPQYVPKLCNFNSPLIDPAPRYDSTNGKMYCHMKATFGRAGWELPVTEIEFPSCHDAYKYFAMFLLNGDVFPKLKPFVKQLLSTPNTMIKSWSKLLPRTEKIQNRLMARDVYTKPNLVKIWKKEKSFLLAEYQQWLPESAHSDITVLWPPID